MKQYARKTINIKRLLEQKDLDIRAVAARNESLTANEYFSKVERFIEDSEQLKDTLLSVSKIAENVKLLKEMEAKLGVSERAVNFTGESEYLKKLEDFRGLLREIGYDKLDLDIESIFSAIKASNLELAERVAIEVLIKFRSFIERISAALTTKKFAHIAAPTGSPSSADPYESILLSEALEFFDFEEANRKLRILAVDDVTIILNSITSMLSPYYEVYALKSSSQVEKFLTQATPELFLLDIEMNEINGFDLIPVIRQFEKHKDTPIIFLTGNASYDNLKGAVALGACDFIKKPVDKETLLEKIGRNIVRKKAY